MAISNIDRTHSNTVYDSIGAYMNCASMADAQYTRKNRCGGSGCRETVIRFAHGAWMAVTSTDRVLARSEQRRLAAADFRYVSMHLSWIQPPSVHVQPAGFRCSGVADPSSRQIQHCIRGSRQSPGHPAVLLVYCTGRHAHPPAHRIAAATLPTCRSSTRPASFRLSCLWNACSPSASATT